MSQDTINGIVELTKQVGFPALVAIYFMYKDSRQTSGIFGRLDSLAESFKELNRRL